MFASRKFRGFFVQNAQFKNTVLQTLKYPPDKSPEGKISSFIQLLFQL